MLNKHKQRYFLFTIAILSVINLRPDVFQMPLLAQQATTKPLELPTFIIEGVEQHNIRSSIKQTPYKPAPLTATELDSLNTFEKLSPTLLPVDRLPAHYIDKSYTDGFIQASYGLFNSPEIIANYRFFADKFDISSSAGGAFSNGDAPNSNNNKLFLDVRTNYIADEKFFIFGGSNTRTNLFVNTQNYNFYGYGKNSTNSREVYPNKNYFDRNLTQAKFEVESDGNFENLLFSVGGTGNYIVASNSSDGNHLLHRDLKDYYASGFLTIKNYWEHFFIGGNLELNFENTGGHPANYYQISALTSYFDSKVSLLLRGGVQAVAYYADNKESNRTGPMVDGNLEYRLSKSVTITAGAFTGLVKTDFEELITLNPYLSSRLAVDHRYDIANLRGMIWYHPNENMQLSAGARWRLSDRNVCFVPDTLSEFKVAYVNGTVMDVFGEALWNITAKDRIIGKINVNMNSPKADYYLSYLPWLKLSSTYYRSFLRNLNAFVTATLVGSQETDINKKNSTSLEPYLLLNAGADITFKPIKIFVNLNNILNTNYMVWDKYTERGFFATLGIAWMF